jgi:hypothetical protein
MQDTDSLMGSAASCSYRLAVKYNNNHLEDGCLMTIERTLYDVCEIDKCYCVDVDAPWYITMTLLVSWKSTPESVRLRNILDEQHSFVTFAATNAVGDRVTFDVKKLPPNCSENFDWWSLPFPLPPPTLAETLRVQVSRIPTDPEKYNEHGVYEGFRQMFGKDMASFLHGVLGVVPTAVLEVFYPLEVSMSSCDRSSKTHCWFMEFGGIYSRRPEGADYRRMLLENQSIFIHLSSTETWSLRLVANNEDLLRHSRKSITTYVLTFPEDTERFGDAYQEVLAQRPFGANSDADFPAVMYRNEYIHVCNL